MIGANSSVFQERALTQMSFIDFLPFVSNLPEPTAFLEEKKSLADVFTSANLSEEAKKSLSNWEVLHTPGHTEGSCCLYNEAERTLISGDTLFFQSWGRTDLEGGSERKIYASLMRLKDYCKEETVVYPGHDHYGFTIKENF
jgi:glyoxylase-like metal-dependent hydrolase (beta-lactamase superfamily II)